MRLNGSRGLAAFCLLAFAGAAPARTVDRYAADGWMVSIRHDAFAGRTECLLRSTDRRIIYKPGALGFRFRHRRDTLGAVYRIDGGVPRRWQDAYPKLIASGVEVEGTGLDDPTGGIVWVPASELAGARTVAVRTSGRGGGHVFAVRGFAAMLDAARRLGCAADASFTG